MTLLARCTGGAARCARIAECTARIRCALNLGVVCAGLSIAGLKTGAPHRDGGILCPVVDLQCVDHDRVAGACDLDIDQVADGSGIQHPTRGERG